MPLHFLFSASWIALASVAAPYVFPVLFGEQWLAAIPYLRAISGAYLAISVLHPVSTALQMMERQTLAAAWQVARLAAVAGSVLAAWSAGASAVSALWCASLAQGAACVVMLGLVAVSIHRAQVRLAPVGD
jgi:O-antigen/teichoic acid export membrane protein